MSTRSRPRKEWTETQRSLGKFTLAWLDGSSTTERARSCSLGPFKRIPSALRGCFHPYRLMTGGPTQSYSGRGYAGCWITGVRRETIHGYLFATVLHRVIGARFAQGSPFFCRKMPRPYFWLATARTTCRACADPAFCPDMLGRALSRSGKTVGRRKREDSEPPRRGARSGRIRQK